MEYEGLTLYRLEKLCRLYKTRATKIDDIISQVKTLLVKDPAYSDEILDKNVLKRWSPQKRKQLNFLLEYIKNKKRFTQNVANKAINDLKKKHLLNNSDIMPVLRIALTGEMKGPDVPEVMSILGKEITLSKLESFFNLCDSKTA